MKLSASSRAALIGLICLVIATTRGVEAIGIGKNTPLSNPLPPFIFAATLYKNTTTCSNALEEVDFYTTIASDCWNVYGLNFTKYGTDSVISPTYVAVLCDELNPIGAYGFSDENNTDCSLIEPVPTGDYCVSGLQEGDSMVYRCMKTPMCKPRLALDQKTCKARNRMCAKFALSMKWTGRGCRDPKTQRPLHDGGCQCNGYCGYQCKGVCNRDKQCYWNAGTQSCWTKANATGPNTPSTPGAPIENCLVPPTNGGN